MDRRINLAYIQDHLAIMEIAKEHGYTLQETSINAAWQQLEKVKDEQKDIIHIKRGDDGYDYFLNASGARGNILSLIKYCGKDIHVYLEEKLGQAIYDSNYEKKVFVQPNLFAIEKHNYDNLARIEDAKNLQALKILTSRYRIPESTIFSETFKRAVGISVTERNNKQYSSLSFPLMALNKENQNEFTGLLKYSYSYDADKNTWEVKSFFAENSSKAKGLWKSTVTNSDLTGSQKLSIIVTRTPIDAMSIDAQRQDGGAVLYVASMGSLTQGQVKELWALNAKINRSLGKEAGDTSNITVALGSDLESLKENIMLKCRLGTIALLAPIEKSSIDTSNSSSRIFLNSNTDEVSLAIRIMKDADTVLANRVIEDVAKDLSNVKISKNEYTSVPSLPSHTYININMPTNHENLKKLDNNLSQVTGINSMHPKSNCWNQDMQENLQEIKKQNLVSSLTMN